MLRHAKSTTFYVDKFRYSIGYRLPLIFLVNPRPHYQLCLLFGQWPGVYAPSALVGAHSLAIMDPIQQPASRCSLKQSSRLKQQQSAGKGDRNLIAYH